MLGSKGRSAPNLPNSISRYIYKSIDVVVISIIFIIFIMGYECSIYMGKNKNLAYSISSQLNA